jgi:hypothetical protein
MAATVSSILFARGTISTIPTLVTGSIVEAAPTSFTAPRAGPFSILVKDMTTNYFWTASFDQPRSLIGSLTTPYTSYINLSAVDNLSNSLAVTVATSTVTVVTNAVDGGGRTYVITFTAFAGTPPTIQKTAGGAVAGKLQIASTYVSASGL